MQSIQCILCKYFIGDVPAADIWGSTCKAFPGGIPDEIMTGLHDHRNPYPDDKGYRFKRAARSHRQRKT